MGLMDNIGKGMIGQLAGQLGGESSQNNKIIGAAAKLIPGIGGLSGLTDMFARHGHGDTVKS